MGTERSVILTALSLIIKTSTVTGLNHIDLCNQPCGSLPILTTGSFIQTSPQFVVPSHAKPIIQPIEIHVQEEIVPTVPAHNYGCCPGITPVPLIPLSPIIIETNDDDKWEQLFYLMLFALKNRGNDGWGGGDGNCGGNCGGCGRCCSCCSCCDRKGCGCGRGDCGCCGIDCGGNCSGGCRCHDDCGCRDGCSCGCGVGHSSGCGDGCCDKCGCSLGCGSKCCGGCNRGCGSGCCCDCGCECGCGCKNNNGFISYIPYPIAIPIGQNLAPYGQGGLGPDCCAGDGSAGEVNVIIKTDASK